ncbi:MAG TPA: hypothetical protein PLE30_02985 [Candidatus Kapabacteria bacterium]|nr:hypothetical protein [Candidatus Kapabacteria bacterium]
MFYLISFQFNDWFSITMPRHQLIQLPLMLLLGIIIAFTLPKLIIKELHWGISALIFIMASLVFWMLPLSIDFTIVSESFNRLMHVNMLICGVLLIATFRGIIFELKYIFMGMVSAMLASTGLSLSVFNILLCSSFDIEQQKETGLLLIIIGVSLFVANIVFFFRALSKKNIKDEQLAG